MRLKIARDWEREFEGNGNGDGKTFLKGLRSQWRGIWKERARLQSRSWRRAEGRERLNATWFSVSLFLEMAGKEEKAKEKENVGETGRELKGMKSSKEEMPLDFFKITKMYAGSSLQFPIPL